MSEVLSQSQIDALLAAARNGDMDMSSTEKDKSEEKKYPKSIRKCRMKIGYLKSEHILTKFPL